MRPSPVQARAEALGIQVRTPLTLRKVEEQQAFSALRLDVAVVAAYGLILPQAVLDAPVMGCINVHASLLPRWRGAAPVQRAILAGDEVTGVTIMQMERGLDTGPMIEKWQVSVDRKTAGELTAELAAGGAELLRGVLGDPRKIAGDPPKIVAHPQPDEGVTYARKVEKAEARIDFTRSATEIERQVRAFNPAPGAHAYYAAERIIMHFCEISDARGEPGTVIDDRLTIACGDGAIVPTLVQRPGGRAMSPEDLLRGFRIPVGSKFE